MASNHKPFSIDCAVATISGNELQRPLQAILHAAEPRYKHICLPCLLCLRKLHQRLDLMCHATSVGGGVYMYANQRGCDGGRLYYDGSACIICNGQLLAQARAHL